jgi:hypothetical protein
MGIDVLAICNYQKQETYLTTLPPVTKQEKGQPTAKKDRSSLHDSTCELRYAAKPIGLAAMQQWKCKCSTLIE